MRLIGLLGVLALLGIAWLVSYHRRSVRFRTVAWGIGLQLLFAVIILREEWWSFAGMTVFGLLILVYLLQKDHTALSRGCWPSYCFRGGQKTMSPASSVPHFLGLPRVMATSPSSSAKFGPTL